MYIVYNYTMYNECIIIIYYDIYNQSIKYYSQHYNIFYFYAEKRYNFYTYLILSIVFCKLFMNSKIDFIVYNKQINDSIILIFLYIIYNKMLQFIFYKKVLYKFNNI